MEWYEILLIVLGGVVFVSSVAIITIFCVYKHALIDKEKTKQETKDFYHVLIEAVGKIENIDNCTSLGSRINFELKDINLVNQDVIKTIQDKGIGIFKTSKKITFVVGEFADRYRLEINKLLNK